jgi:cbb3-type cytochrome oxidase subunit 3
MSDNGTTPPDEENDNRAIWEEPWFPWAVAGAGIALVIFFVVFFWFIFRKPKKENDDDLGVFAANKSDDELLRQMEALEKAAKEGKKGRVHVTTVTPPRREGRRWDPQAIGGVPSFAL